MMAAYGSSRLWSCTLLQTATFSLHRLLFFFLSTKVHFPSIAVEPQPQSRAEMKDRMLQVFWEGY